MSTFAPANAAAGALEVLRRGIGMPIPIPKGLKGPQGAGTKGWPGWRFTEAEIPHAFVNGVNVGLLLGPASRGLTDVDLDTREAVILGRHWLPPTELWSGRGKRPWSHAWYRTPAGTPYLKLNDPTQKGDDACLVELRAADGTTGRQTVIAPSVVAGDLYRWESWGEPAELDSEAVVLVVERIAAGALLARHYPPHGTRHDAVLALAGFLLRRGQTEGQARDFMLAVAEAAADPEASNAEARKDIASAVRYTANDLAAKQPTTGGKKLLDFFDGKVLDAVSSWLHLTAAPVTAPTDSAPPARPLLMGPYEIKGGRFVFRKGSDSIVLTNFIARIVEDLAVDDGADSKRVFVLEGKLDTGAPLPRAEVPASQFSSLNWIPDKWGADALLVASQSAKDRTREAIQRLSLDPAPRRRTVYKHTGWRTIAGSPVFLHAGGGIGAEGAREDVEVSLGGGLAAVRLPDPPAAAELPKLVRRTLAALGRDLAPDRIALPLLAAVFRAPMVEAVPVTFSLFCSGRTGTFKTEMATLGQRFFGAGFSAQALPANFSSTANNIEKVTFLAKDVLLTVDEFTPKGSTQRDAAEIHAKGERIFRGVGNVSARGRLSCDGELRHGYVPRGLLVGTGEDLPRGQSLQARMLVLEFGTGDVKPAGLTKAQAAAEEFPLVMAGFLRWLAPRLEALRSTGRARVAELRERASAGTIHRRTPDTMASLYLGAETFARFAVDVGALTEAESADLLGRTWKALGEVAAGQASHLKAADPVERFQALLEALFSSGRAHVLDRRTGQHPDNARRWGWDVDHFSAGTVMKPNGTPIGYVDEGSNLFLNPESAYAELQKLAANQGESFPVSAGTLWKMLEDRGRIRREPKSEHRTVRITVRGGQQGRVIHILPAPEETEKATEPEYEEEAVR